MKDKKSNIIAILKKVIYHFCISLIKKSQLSYNLYLNSKVKYKKIVTRNYLAVFNWHQVTPEFVSGINNELTWTGLEKFNKELLYIRENFNIIPLSEGLARLKKNQIKGPCAALTFDDGDISVEEYIAPLLIELNIPATFFINSAYLSSNKSSYWVPVVNYFRNNKKMANNIGFKDTYFEVAEKLRFIEDPIFYNKWRMEVEKFAEFIPKIRLQSVSLKWLSNINSKLFALGIHGHEHQRFSMMSSKWQKENILKNMEFLSQFNGYVPLFALPFGRISDWNQDTVTIAKQIGVDLILADGGLNISNNGHCKRIPCDNQNIRKVLNSNFLRV